jgi:hypothetical protein
MTREVRLDLAGRARFASLLEVFHDWGKEKIAMLGDVGVNRVERLRGPPASSSWR